ncbi:extracellular solute-binding protein family 1 [Beutenbergia cavernae DSM 12333]|uniref:Extracellular solute-binding protein family 1 n=1 Tax=Beutenbergia cavernae (strain ATCC BAA-8 / DSM 12333 / CCUG 43141 / JCM 11478 / NBRC 16432 / NCIMB 13614 / HKI 0122) TaxID=471853 RepID=C5C2Q5_BEUC1|nr:extracellular solute-binding protein [Beutenbergia cavernae]ACQ79741.1 extracellular solute-binding protein family 1 [Beutenbergia cavernae DSM 12333]
MKQRLTLATALAASAALALTACSGGASGAEDDESPTPSAEESEAPSDLTGSLEIWTDGTKFPAVEAIIATFEADYPGVDVELVQKNFSDIGNDFTTQVPTGEGPDIIVTPHDAIGNFVKAGLIAPVELGALADALNPVAVEAFSVDGQAYGVPYALENIGLIRNNALTTDAPETWDEMLASTDAVGAEFGMVTAVTEAGNPYNMYPVETSFGSEIFARDDQGNYLPELTLGNEEGFAFAEWLGTQGPGGTGAFDPAMTDDIAKQAFLDGRAPYFLSGPWQGADIREAGLDVDVLPVPSAGGEPSRPFVGVQGFVVSAESENQLLANEFLTSYVGSVEGQLELFRYGPGTPALTEAAESPEVTDDPLNAGFAAAGADGVPMPSIPEMGLVWVPWGRAQVDIMNGADPRATWQTMADNIQQAIDES